MNYILFFETHDHNGLISEYVKPLDGNRVNARVVHRPQLKADEGVIAMGFSIKVGLRRQSA
ncbi:hypothetical protein V0M98_33730 (plasmid) [Pseudomonas silesiensis]|uniref:hypothetical protein n=1 Tax=Pseudomonas silesiensis TaxID=1853130 RepID=UPI0030CB4A4F